MSDIKSSPVSIIPGIISLLYGIQKNLFTVSLSIIAGLSLCAIEACGCVTCCGY